MTARLLIPRIYAFILRHKLEIIELAVIFAVSILLRDGKTVTVQKL